MNSFCDVVRDGVRQSVSTSELVVGDIAFIKAGEVVGADGYVISGGVSVNQSALNGEGREVYKKCADFDGAWASRIAIIIICLNRRSYRLKFSLSFRLE